MSAIADVPLVNITINDIPVQVPKGEMIVESVKRIGLEIPIFCYHPRLLSVGMCRMCLVEVGTKGPDGSVRMMPKPQTACSLPASEGLVIVTDSEKIHTDRRGILEFLLINHPLDCPICDRGGECPLQNNTLFYGPSTSRFVEVKRHAPKAFPLGTYVTLDLERCIQCGRCVRFTEEISGDSQLAFRFRGAQMQPSTFELTDFTSKFSGNVIEICPVGALTNRQYRFRARPWDLQTRPGICTNCSNGCNVYLDHRNGQIVRVNGRTNEGVNEEWTCDKGKFGHDWYNSDNRLARVLIRKGSGLVPADWPDAYAQIQSGFVGKTVAVLSGGKNSNEDLFSLSQLFRKGFSSEHIDHRFESHIAHETPSQVESTIEDFESGAPILVFGSNLADESPILHLRIRKAWFKRHARVIVASDVPTDADDFASVVIRYRPGTAGIVAKGLLALAGTPTKDIATFSPERVELETGVPAEVLRSAAANLTGLMIATTSAVFDNADGADVSDALGQLATSVSGRFNRFARHANEEGARLVGFAPTAEGKDTQAILEGCAKGTIHSLWLAGVNPFELCADRALVQRALENVEFLVVQDVQETEATSYASVVLPMTGPAEMDGTYTNLERRVQRLQAVIPPKGDAKQVWRVAEELLMRVQPNAPHFNPSDVMDTIARTIPIFEGCSYEALGSEGFLLGRPPVPPVPFPQVPAESAV